MKTLILLGMHRSGTSCLAGSLQRNGVYLGDVHTYNPHNTKGNRENQTIVDLNDTLLAVNNSNWDLPPTTKLKWNDSHTTRRSTIISDINKIAETSSYSYWGFKDPRTLLTLDFWQEASLNASYVGTFRHPLSVARSLNKRSELPIEVGIALWDAYNSILLKAIKAAPFPLICFDTTNDQYIKNLTYLYETLSLENTNKSLLFFDDTLRTNNEDRANYPLTEKTKNLYKELLNIHANQFR